MKKWFAFTVILFLLTSISGNAAPLRDPGTPPYKKGELLVKYRDEAEARRSHASKKAGVIKGFKRLNIHHVKLPSSLSVEDAIREYKKDPNVEYAEPNYIVRKSVLPNDPRYSDQWGHTKISSPAAWDIATGSTNIIVAVLDTGIDYSHDDLAGNMWVNPGETPGNGTDDDGNGVVDDIYGANFGGTSPGNPMDDDIADSHGTHVAGIIGAVGNNGVGVSGVNWGVRLMAVKFLHGSAGEGYTDDAVSGIMYAVDNGARVINCSFEIGEYSSSLEGAIKDADSKGVIVVSAAGNSNLLIDNISVSPASIKTANNITVASTTSSDIRSSFSNYGRATVDVAAPGSDILSTTNHCQDEDWNNVCENGTVRTRGYDYLSGTSMAAPQVSGLAALIWSNHTSISHYQVKGRILNGVDKLAALSTTTITGGRINAYNSLSNPELPAIFKIEPRTLQPGGSVTITGVNFGTYSSVANTVTVNDVSLNDVPLTVNTWQDTTITATAPDFAFSGDAKINGQGSGFYLSVEYQPLSVNLTASPPHGYLPLAVTFTATASNSETVVKYEWDFEGDGVYDKETTENTASLTYTNAGSYPVKVQVTDSGNQTAIGSVRVDVFESGGSSGGGGGCFIATAAYGSYEAPYVKILREFRDNYLIANFKVQIAKCKIEIPNILGRGFVKTYYKVSPPVADFIAESELLKAVVRLFLLPFIGVAAFLLKTTLLQKVMFGFAGILLIHNRRRTLT